MFICLEGIDGSGKTTQARMLAAHLGKTGDTILTIEPTKGGIGTFVHSLLKEVEGLDSRTRQLLFVADRAEHVLTTIEPAVRSGKHVVCDRYIMSTIVYGCAGGLDEEWLMKLNSKFPEPDATLIIDVSADTAMDRIMDRQQERLGAVEAYFERQEFLEAAREQYKRLASVYKNTYIIDGDRDEGEVLKDLIKIVDKL